jgi:hypothetical protein
MGKIRKAMLAFIDSIPDSNLEGGIASATIYTNNKNFRLDNQGTRTAKDGKPACYNLQMQINDRPKLTSLEDASHASVAVVERPVMETWTAQEVKDALKKSLVEHGERTGQDRVPTFSCTLLHLSVFHCMGMSFYTWMA